MPTFSKASWIGPEGALFERVALVFGLLGYGTPIGPGCYVSDLCDDYQADCTPDEILAIVSFASRHTEAALMGLRFGDLILVDGTVELVGTVRRGADLGS